MIDKETISFQEFRAWLTGLIVGRRGALPDLDDWRQIKVMIDKVEEKEQPLLQPSPVGPYQPSYPQPVTPHPDIYPPMPQPYWSPNTDPYSPNYPGWGTWCGDTQVIRMGGCSGDSVSSKFGDVADTFADTTVTYSMTNSVNSDTIQMDLDLGNMDVVTSGFVQVAVEEESKKLGNELQKMIEENENGQKESS